MSSALFSLRAGATVTHPRFVLEGRPACAVVVEVWPGDLAELDNGHYLPARELASVATGERWAPVTGYDGRYLVSSHGKVVSTAYHRATRTRLLRFLAPTRYPAVALSNAAGVTRVGINRLVAQHFLLPPAEARLTVVLPRDGNHLNLHVDNLQWVDPREAEDEDVAPRLHPRGERHRNSRLTSAQVVEVRQLAAQGNAQQAIADQFGVSRPAISYIVNGQTRRHA
jgi:predicted XRE-type DNA-binding protein